MDIDRIEPLRDADGHLRASADWSPALARALAGEANIVLAADHWRVIRTVRAFYEETGVSPSMRPLVAVLRDRAPHLASSIALLKLFPGSPATLAAKIAGLPHPDKCR